MQIIPRTWHQLVYDADLVGILECTVAGSVVARYRVAESWKGPAAGTEVTVRALSTTYGPHYPMALVGERYLGALRRTASSWKPATSLSDLPAGGHPLLWRLQSSDYCTPLHEGWLLVRGGTPVGWPADPNAFPHGVIETFRAEVDSFTRLTAAAQEGAVLRSVSGSFLSRTWSNWPDPYPPDIARLRDRFTTADTRGVISAWLEWAKGTTNSGGALFEVLQAGGPITLEMIRDSTRISAGIDRRYRGLIVDRIQRRVTRTLFELVPDQTQPDTGAVDVSLLADSFPYHRGRNEFRRTFQAATAREPERVADLLMTWPPDESRAEASYAMGAYFAWKCGGDRARHLKRLLNAKDPTIRVAAAVYLRFEDRPAGMRALKEFMSLSGVAGAWAAVTLAREGVGDALPRAFEALKDCPGVTQSSALQRQVQQQLLVLLSNALRVDDHKFPEEHYYFPHQWGEVYWQCDRTNLPFYTAVTGWWSGRGDTSRLRDPWLDELTALKVD